jgi:DNA-binding LacI/PurR family transcriptional regulator
MYYIAWKLISKNKRKFLMPEIMNIKTFAKISGYSPASISRAFSNKSRIAEETANEILRLAEKYHFRPNRAAAASFGNRTQSVGILMYSLKTSYFADIYSGIQAAMDENLHLPIYLEANGQNDYHTLSRLIDHRVDGLIMIDISRSLDVAEKMEIKRMKLPLVMIEPPLKTSGIDWVKTDDDTGGRLLAEYLLKIGHRNFVIVGSNGQRCLSFQSAVKKNGGKVKTCTLVGGANFKEKLREELAFVLSRPDRPTAIFCDQDIIAPEVYKIVRKQKLKIPKDISIAGYADLNIASAMYPELTTIRQDGYTVGKMAAELMLQRISNPDMPIKHEIIPVELQIRDSCAHIAN